MTSALARVTRLDQDALARATGLHPDMVGRWTALGLLDATRDTAGRLWFAPSQILAVARLQRLRAGFSLNYAALGLVADLLDRIAALEASAARNRTRGKGEPPWTRIG
ncbi:MAG: chaperone modulatory protein CbpM [Actinomycetota bacterium]|nr:chaperone modulatory protein CbpM [Actinomycetota bacterium]